MVSKFEVGLGKLDIAIKIKLAVALQVGTPTAFELTLQIFFLQLSYLYTFAFVRTLAGTCPVNCLEAKTFVSELRSLVFCDQTPLEFVNLGALQLAISGRLTFLFTASVPTAVE